MMRGVQRTLSVFECFSPERTSLTLQEIADRLRLPKSTTFRIVGSLEEAAYLIRLEDQRYCLSMRVARLAGMVMGNLNIRQVARPLMQALARRTGETITLNTVHGTERVCVDVIDTPAPLMSVARPGQHVRLDRGATALTLMAHLTGSELNVMAGQVARVTKRKRSEVLADAERIRRDGYCVTHGERVLGLSAIAAPIRGSGDATRYCVTITGPTVRLQPRTAPLVALVLEAARDISRRLGMDNEPATASGPARAFPRAAVRHAPSRRRAAQRRPAT